MIGTYVPLDLKIHRRFIASKLKSERRLIGSEPGKVLLIDLGHRSQARVKLNQSYLVARNKLGMLKSLQRNNGITRRAFQLGRSAVLRVSLENLWPHKNVWSKYWEERTGGPKVKSLFANWAD